MTKEKRPTKRKNQTRPHIYLLRVPEPEWQRFTGRCKQNGWAYSWVLRRLIQDFAEQMTEMSPVPRAGGPPGER